MLQSVIDKLIEAEDSSKDEEIKEQLQLLIEDYKKVDPLDKDIVEKLYKIKHDKHTIISTNIYMKETKSCFTQSGQNLYQR